MKSPVFLVILKERINHIIAPTTSKMRQLLFFFLALSLASCLKIENPRNVDHQLETADTTRMDEYTIQEYAALSLTGQRLYPPELSNRDKNKREQQLSDALVNFNSNPDSLEYIIWFGRRLSYLFLYKEAITVYSEGLRKFPNSYELYRHRGHRFLTIRKFDEAIADLQKAAFLMRNKPIKMEHSGASGVRNIPRSSVQFNVWYHLGLAYYLKGNYDKSVSAYKQCLAIANNDDMLVSATDWLYMTYRRLGNHDAASELLDGIHSRMNVIEKKSYLRKLLFYKGQRRPDEMFDLESSDLSGEQMTYGYGVGNWYYYTGNTARAFEIFNKMMESESWPSFGFLAAEVELANQDIGS